MKHSLKTFCVLTLMLIGNWALASPSKPILKEEKKENHYKPFISLRSTRTILTNDTKYFGFDLGLKLKCKYKFGYSYSRLKGSYKTDMYRVDLIQFPSSNAETKTDVKFNSLVFEPIVIKDKKVNISLPFRLGLASIISEYKTSIFNFTEYHTSFDPFAEFGANLDYRILGIMKIGISVSYRYVHSDLEIAQKTFSAPLFSFNLKLGRMCK